MILARRRLPRSGSRNRGAVLLGSRWAGLAQGDDEVRETYSATRAGRFSTTGFFDLSNPGPKAAVFKTIMIKANRYIPIAIPIITCILIIEAKHRIRVFRGQMRNG